VHDSSGVLVGIVRDARDQNPAGGVTVVGQWLEYSFRKSGMTRSVPRRVATTGENGWFAMCNVPSGGTMTLIANRDADSTDLIEVVVPDDGFARREFYLGTNRTNVRPISGTVHAAVGGKPISGAQVGIPNGPKTRTNAQGEWSLPDAPVGSRMLEVRALGFYPERRHVHVIDGAAPVRFVLSTLKAVLDTVRISSSRRMFNRAGTGFQERMASGVGTFLTPFDIAKQQAIRTSDIFRVMHDIRVEYDSTGFEAHMMVRGNTEAWCNAEIYLDGHHLFGATMGDLDTWVQPREIKGIEIYSRTVTPVEFQQGMGGCGAILIWTK
jgi:hypothetical protein